MSSGLSGLQVLLRFMGAASLRSVSSCLLDMPATIRSVRSWSSGIEQFGLPSIRAIFLAHV
jgi:hypothetical protein